MKAASISMRERGGDFHRIRIYEKRSTPTLKSKIVRGLRPVNRMAEPANKVVATNATPRPASTMKCGMARIVFTIQS